MNIDLHIERLILDGLPIEHNQGSLVKSAVEKGTRAISYEERPERGFSVEWSSAFSKSGGHSSQK